MRKEAGLFHRVTEGLDLAGEPMPSESIVEILGDDRILIEKHMGITQYSSGKICVKVRYGCLAICGSQLELSQMTREVLVITGRIDTVAILRRH